MIPPDVQDQRTRGNALPCGGHRAARGNRIRSSSLPPVFDVCSMQAVGVPCTCGKRAPELFLKLLAYAHSRSGPANGNAALAGPIARAFVALSTRRVDPHGSLRHSHYYGFSRLRAATRKATSSATAETAVWSTVGARAR